MGAARPTQHRRGDRRTHRLAAALDRFDAAQAELAALSFDALTASEGLTVKDRLETVYRRQAAVDHRLTHQLTAQASPVEFGGKSWTDVLSNRLRIGRGKARRRLDEADHLGPGTAMTGEPLQPALPNVAAAQAAGKISGLVDAEAHATIDAVLAKWASPGMRNPDDDSPCVDGSPSEAHIQNDQRSQAQRNHDALKAMGRSVLASGERGQHNGLPCTIVVTTTLQELESGIGHAVTGGGTLLPMSDVIRQASNSPPLSGYLRQTHRRAVVPRPQQAPRIGGTAHRATRQGPRLRPGRVKGRVAR